MLGNGVEMSLIFRRILGPLSLDWAPNHFVLGAQLAPGEKSLACIPEVPCKQGVAVGSPVALVFWMRLGPVSI